MRTTSLFFIRGLLTLLWLGLLLGLNIPMAQAQNGTTVAGGNGQGSGANQLNSPYKSYVDASGNIYVADANNHRIQKWAPGASSGTTVAGGNGPGSGANQLNTPTGVFVDASGNVYVADGNNFRIQKWAPGASNGTTVAGGNGLGSGANQLVPSDIFVDASGNIYVADGNNHRIQKWAPGASSGTTVAGGNGQGGGANQLSYPAGVFVDASGNLYVADGGNSRIQKWAPGASSGTTVAGGNGTGTGANQLYGPLGVFVDASGNVYIADTFNFRIQRWAPGASSGTTVAGGKGQGSGTNQLDKPYGVFVDAPGNIYVTDTGNNRIQKFSPVPVASSGTTVAGGNGPGSGANQLNTPYKSYVDASGNVYVADAGNNRIQRWAPGASSGTTVAGGNGLGSGANQLDTPDDIFVDASGNIYVADLGNNRIQKWAPGASSGTTVAGGNGPGSGANQLHDPVGVFVDASGNIYVVDAGNSRIQKWAPGAAVGTTVAGGNGPGSGANQLSTPADVFVDASGNVYIADTFNFRIQRWAPGASSGTTVAGGNGQGDGANELSYPAGVFVDASGNIYVADGGNSRIQKWAPGASSGTTVAGGNGPGSGANQLIAPFGVFVDASGNIYVTDRGNHRVQKFSQLSVPTLTGLSASPNPVCVGQPTQFTAMVGNVSGSYNYTLTNGAGSILQGTATATAFSQSLTAVGAGTQSYTLTVTTNGGVATTTTGLTVNTQSPDYQPLADLYNSTGGDNWKNHTGWLTGCTPCGWYGVTCDGSGRVTGIDLTRNGLAGPIPASLSQLTSLQALQLLSNQLSGPIPANLSNLTNLTFLGLGRNQLTGTIPPDLSKLTSLTVLAFDNNKLEGTIPDRLSALTNLQALVLSDNKLSGSIPTSLSALANLQSLYLSDNQLSGSIPAGLGNLTKFRLLFLNNNQLSGCFPASFSALCGVPYIDLSNNPGLPGGGDFAAFCASGAGSDAFRPLATVSPNPVCAGSPVSLSVSAGTFYQWSGPASFSATTPAPTFIPATAASSGLYSVTVGNGSPTCTATASVSLTVNPQPTVSISPSATAVCAGQSALFAATPGLSSYRWTTPNNGPVLTTASISVSVAGTYSLTVTNASGCTATAQTSLTVNPLPTPAIVGLVSSICQEAAPVTLTGLGSPAGGSFTIDGTPATSFTPASLSVGQHTVVYSYTNTSGCSNTASQTVTVKPTPQTPTIATQSGHAYPAGVSSLTISQNTGDVVLTASGCMGGTITWQGGNNTTLAVATTNTGPQTFSATCSQNGCTSPLATATVTVVGTTLSVLHRDGNGNTSTNTLAPYLQLQNEGKTPIPYAEITVRYWLTVENYSPLLFAINYAQLGSDKVHLKYMPATTGNPKASGYIEFSFDASAGSLGAMSNSGPIQDIINKQDYSYFDQSNDYSYVNTGNYTPNQRITAYRNGVLFWGQEPGPVTPTRSLKAQLQNNTGDGANTIEAVLQVTNDGSLPVNYSDLKVRYYFTQDNTQPLVLSQVGYTALGSGNVSAQLVGISPASGGADTYLELSFSSGLGQLAPGASTGGVTYQIRHADYSGFTQANDYSYQGTGGLALAPHVVVLVGGQRVWGTEPGAAGRLAASEPETPLQVRVLGNPVRGSAIELVVRGAEGQPLQLTLTDLQGRLVSERAIEQAGAVEHQTLLVGQQPAGLLLLRVSTPSQSQTVKVLKTE